MKKILYTIMTIAVSLSFISTAFAQQNLRSAYFLDGYTYKYKMNPAFAPERGFFSLPAISSISVGAETNVGLSDFIFTTPGGGLTTFMNSSVSSQDFLGGIRDMNRVNANVNTNILAFGFRTGKAFHTVDLSLRADAGVRIPKTLFSFLKDGASSGSTAWDISGVGARVDSRLELAYGYSRPLNDWINIGARVKFLVGLARADVMVDELDLNASGTRWSATTHGTAEVSGPMSFGTKGGKEIDFSNIAMPESFADFTSALSYGAALDLGASFDILDFLTASVAVTDLGFISWAGTTTAQMPGGTWTYDGLGAIDTGDGSSLGDQFSAIGDELLEMLKLEKTGDNLKKSRGLAATVHVGVEAMMPFYKRLTFGLLGTQKIDGPYSWTEGRISANVAPVNWFSAALTAAVSTYGSSVGGVINLHTSGFTLFAGVDSFLPLMNVTPQFVPVGKINTNVSFGIHATFGKAVGKYRDMKKKEKEDEDEDEENDDE